MQKQKKLGARIVSLALSATMVFTTFPATVFAAEGNTSPEPIITAFDELGEGFIKSVPSDGHTYVRNVKLHTPFEEVKLPTELGVTVEKTTTNTTSSAPADEPTSSEPTNEPTTTPANEPTTTPANEPTSSAPANEPTSSAPANEPTSSEPAAQTADTDSSVSGNESAAAPDAETTPAPAPVEKPDTEAPPVEKPDAEAPPVDEPKQENTTLTEITQETIPVTWTGDREYTPDQNSKVTYTAVLPEGYALADGVKLPTIYVMVGRQARAARAGDIATGTSGTCSWIIDAAGELTISPTDNTSGILAFSDSDTPSTWASNNADITSVVVKPGVATEASAAYLFANLKKCTKMDLSALDTSAATDMMRMFSNCSALPRLDLSSFNTANVTNMQLMFTRCKVLTSLDVSNFNTANVTNMQDMFDRCETLKSLNLSSFNTTKVTNMKEMFVTCTALTSLNVSSFDTTNVTNMNSMFSGCVALTSLNVSGFTTANVTDMFNMFYDCTALTSLDVSSFNTAMVTDMTNMFTNCSALTSLNVSNFNTANVTEMYGMFSGCTALTSLDVSGFDTANVIDINDMFIGCQALKSLDLSSFNTSAASEIYGLLEGSNSLESIQFGANFNKTIPLPLLALGGKGFEGWYTNAEGTGSPVVDKNGGKYTTPAGTIVYTKWISYGPAIAVATQTGNATYGTAASSTFAVTNSNFGGSSPVFAPSIAWTKGAPTGVTSAFSPDKGTLTMTTTAKTPVDEYKFRVVSPKTGGGNYESAEATLKVDKLTVTIQWDSIISFPYNGSSQAPTATVSNKVGGDDVSVTVTGGQTNAGTGYTATASALAGAKAGNYTMPIPAPTQGFTITKAAYTGTQAAAPSSTPISKTATSITLNSQTISGESVEYGIKKSDGTITWLDNTTFHTLTANTDYHFFARVKETTNHEAGVISVGTIIKTDISDADKVAKAKVAVTAALKNLTPTNATDASAIMATVNKALTDAGITEVTPAWDASGAFNKTAATENAAGNITGIIKLTCGIASDTVTLSKTIAQLPIDPAAKIALVKKVIEDALKNFSATNTTTDADIKAIVDKANTDSGVKTVTVAWKTPSDFNNTNSTNEKDGKVTGTLDLSCTDGGSTVTGTVSVNCPIERNNAQKLAGAILDANNAMKGVVIDERNPSSVASGTKFVKAAEKQALTDAITAAEAVANKTNPPATNAELTAAANTLKAAVNTFKVIIKTGTYTSGGNNNNNNNSNDDSSSGSTNTTAPPKVVIQEQTNPAPPTTGQSQTGATVDNNGNASATLTDQTMQNAIDRARKEAERQGTAGNGIAVVIHVTTGGMDANTMRVNLPETLQKKIIAGNVLNTVLVLDRPDISLNMNLATITEINRQAKSDVQLIATRMDSSTFSGEAKRAIAGRPTYDLRATYDNGTKSIHSLKKGSMTLAIPYIPQKGEVAGGLYAVYVDDKKANYITNSSYDEASKKQLFATNQLGVFGIGYKAPIGFKDIKNHWAKTDIEFGVNRGLFSGTRSKKFAPDSEATHGMFATALGRMANTDVSGILTGNADKAMADASITHEQMAVMLYHYTQAIGYTLPITHAEKAFADSHQISPYARDVIKAMQMAGILNGKSGNLLDPQGIATKAEATAILHRFIELVITTESAQGWMKNDSGKWMFYENGKAVTGNRKIGAENYLFDQYGEMVDALKK